MSGIAEEIREALDKIERCDYSEIDKAYANAGRWLRWQQGEIERLTKERDAYDAWVQALQRDNQQLREELEQVKKERDSHGPEGRNYTNAQYVALLQELAEKDKVLESVADEIDNSIDMLREDAFENWDEAVNVLTSASRSISIVLSKYKEDETV